MGKKQIIFTLFLFIVFIFSVIYFNNQGKVVSPQIDPTFQSVDSLDHGPFTGTKQ